MNHLLPWYHRASCFQLVIFGALASPVLFLAFEFALEPNEAMVRFSILLNENEWTDVLHNEVIGKSLGMALAGAVAGALVFRRLKKKYSGSA